MRAGGRYVSVVPGSLPSANLAADVETSMSYVNEDGQRLAGLVGLVDAGHLRLRTATAYPLADVAAAHRGPHPGGPFGKVALVAG